MNEFMYIMYMLIFNLKLNNTMTNKVCLLFDILISIIDILVVINLRTPTGVKLFLNMYRTTYIR